LQDPSLPGAVLADHSGPYTNPYFGSRFDTQDNVNFTFVADVATLLARTLFILAEPNVDNITVELGKISVNHSLVSALFYCLSVTYDCELFNRFIPNLAGDIPDNSSNYGGVFGTNRIPNLFVYNFVYTTLATDVGSNCTSPSQCNGSAQCIANFCMNASVSFHDAISPAFLQKEDGSWAIVNDSYPVWTESTWASLSVRIFPLEGSWAPKWLITIGIVELFGFLVVFLVWISQSCLSIQCKFRRQSS